MGRASVARLTLLIFVRDTVLTGFVVSFISPTQVPELPAVRQLSLLLHFLEFIVCCNHAFRLCGPTVGADGVFKQPHELVN